MLRRKFKFNDIEVNDRKVDECFTDDSYVIISIPSMKDKIEMQSKFSSLKPDDWNGNYELVKTFIHEIKCYTNDDEKTEIDNIDDLTCFTDGMLFIQWINHIIANGFMPKKA